VKPAAAARASVEQTVAQRISRVWVGERAQAVWLEVRRGVGPRPSWALVTVAREGEARRETYATRREAVAAMRACGPW
jgi:hypothetical protein